MAYAVKATATVEVMLKNFAALSKEVAGLEKTKPLPKDKIKTLKAELDRKGKAVGAKLNELITAAQKDFAQHGALVDKHLGEAARALVAAKKAATDFDKTKNPKVMLDFTRLNLPAKIKALHEQAKADQKDFGKSWFELRGYNTRGSAGDDVLPYVKTFFEKRSNLMGAGKAVDTKVDQIEDKADEITVLVNEMRATFTGGSVAPKDAEDGIAEVTGPALDWSKNTKPKFDSLVKQIAKFVQIYGAAPKPEQKEVEQLNAGMREGLATSKAVKSKVELHAKKVAQAKKMFGGASKKGDADLKAAEDMLKAWPADIKALIDVVTLAAKEVPKIQAKVKKAA